MDRFIDILFYIFLILTAVKDIKEKIISDILNIMIIILGVMKIIFFNGDFEKSIIGMGVFPLVFIIIYGYISEILKKDVIGFGDIKFMGAAGFYLGYSGIYNLIILYNTIFITAFIIVFPLLLLKKIKKEAEIPFAPFISAGVLIFLFLDKF